MDPGFSHNEYDNRCARAAWAEGYVATEYPDVRPGSEKFYDLVLDKAQTTEVIPHD